MAAFLEWLRAWILQLITVGIPALAGAWAFFKWLGQRWIEQKFQKQLETLKHEHQKELESVRHEIQKTYSRVTKIHEREFEILPKAWFMLHEAMGMAVIAVGMGVKYVPDFATMREEVFKAFLADEKRLPAFNKGELEALPPKDRSAYYTKITGILDLDEANNKTRILNNYLIEHRIFLSPELQQAFNVVVQSLLTGLNEFSIGKRHGDFKLEQDGFNKIAGLQNKVPDVERAVQRRLHYDEA